MDHDEHDELSENEVKLVQLLAEAFVSLLKSGQLDDAEGAEDVEEGEEV